MAVNLVRNYDRAEAEHLVNSSFAQFQTDRDVVRLEKDREGKEAYLASYKDRMRCELGDVDEYRKLLVRLQRAEGKGGRLDTRASRVEDAIGRLRPGDVFDIRGGKRRGLYAALEVTQSRSERRPRVFAVSDRGALVRLTPTDFRNPPVVLARVRLKKGFDSRDAAARRDVTQKLRTVTLDRDGVAPARDGSDGAADELAALRDAIERHPVHDCPELHRHLHFGQRADRLKKEISSIDRRVGRRTRTLARRFEQVLEVLEELGYVDRWELTDKGETLSRVYNVSDLLVVEALREGLFEDLDSAELAAVASTLVYEARGPEMEDPGEMPTGSSSRVWRQLLQLWRRIRRREDERGLELTREPDPGYAQRTYLWAAGKPLEDVLDEGDAAGDFVRNMKQLIDLLRQIEEVAPTDALASTVRTALDQLRRGVVAYSSLDL
jgi:ATP-dependent RNA helicase HelY